MANNRSPGDIRRMLEVELGQWIMFGHMEISSLPELERKILVIYELLLELPRDSYYNHLTHYVIPRAIFFTLVFSAHQRQQPFARRPARESTPVRERFRIPRVPTPAEEAGTSPISDPE